MKTILSTSIESLKKDQHDFLQQFAINRLEEVILLLKARSYERVLKDMESWEWIIWFYWAGDWYGNYYIQFNDCGAAIEDIWEVFKTLDKLSK